MNKKLNNAIKHAKITVEEVQSDSMYYEDFYGDSSHYSSNTYVRPHKETNYHYTINIGGLSTDDMIAFMNWFKEVNPDWLEGIDQRHGDDWDI